VVVAQQTDGEVGLLCVALTRFEYSADGRLWHLIGEKTNPVSDLHTPDRWEVRWNPLNLASGPYLLRATMIDTHGLERTSPPTPILVDQPPVARATASLVDAPDGGQGADGGADSGPGTDSGQEADGAQADGGQEAGGGQDSGGLQDGGQGPVVIEFDGSGSQDVDGTVVGWRWDFDDGQTLFGSTVTRQFSDSRLSHVVSLTVTDNAGATGITTYDLLFLPELTFVQDESCRCTDITLRADDLKALGPTGVQGGRGWDPADGWDGKMLGPLDKQPLTSNPASGLGGQKKWTGFAFEVVTDTVGNSKLCKEIQLARCTRVLTGFTKRMCEDRGGTFTAPDTCTLQETWQGTTADLDKDGTNDIDVSTQAKCLAAGGTWNADKSICTLTFPQNGPKYGPDTPESSQAGGAYESDFTYKVHLANKIIWTDTPGFTLGARGSTMKCDFVHLVRGTDNKICFIKSSLNLQRTPGAEPDVEQVTQTDKGVDVGSVPGVP
jgi:hypothetical protein